MDSINTILNLVTKDCFMESVDLKDAYYSVKITESFQRYLKFEFLDKLYKFICFPNGLGPCPRKFTKITKVPPRDLRTRKIVVSGYINDFFTKEHTSKGCFNNVMSIAELFDRLGFAVHPDKSVLIATREITILGFVINSRKISVKLTSQKEKNQKVLVNQLFSMKTPSIRFLAKVIGTIVSVFPAVKYAPLYHRALENDKIRALENCKADSDSHHPISDDAKDDLKWWRDNNQMENWIHPPIIDTKLFCDASDFAWGSVLETKRTGGACSETEKEYHINEKELLAVFYTLKSFKSDLQDKHIKTFSDNTTAVAVINKMGTCKNHALNKRAQQIWGFCQQLHIWITAFHIPGKEKFEADYESRREYKDAEGMLNPKIFNEAQNILSCQPQTDCFATRINTQLSEYFSRRPDPEAKFIDVFTVNWRPYL